MHKLRKTAVLVVALGSVGLLSAGTAHADGSGREGHVMQSSNCKSHDLDLDLLGEVGILNGALANVLNGEGSPGAQYTHNGSSMGCDNRGW
ncbi:hypothetical protein ACH41H_05900 [Streptomyces sp. NPDC020800]|uniref:hypothetical protein n=1 Tax=Streptomyces sp. NPDC020800 TaxID=3365092 RepID=UPI0037BD3F3D